MPDWIWIFLIAALVAISCSLVGSFLVLRRMAMLGDAISHAVLPGIAIAFLLTASRNSWIMLVGAAVLGMVTAFLVQILSRGGGVRNDAAIGVTFTSLFALGVILISKYASRVDLDTDCVLYGVIEFAPMYTLDFNGRSWGPMAFWQMLVVATLCLAFVVLLWKELKLVTFDAQTAAALGISATAVHYALMGMVSVATVGAFEPVGAILVVAMLVVPPATAYLLTDDLRTMVFLACVSGVLAAFIGTLLADRLNVSTAGAMTVVSGALFFVAILFSPRHGIVAKRMAHKKLSRDVTREDALQALWREREIFESGRTATAGLSAEAMAAFTRSEVADSRRALQRLVRERLVASEAEGFVLTEAGAQAAKELVHRHRVYESYLGELGYPVDHIHDAADRVEHYLSPNLTEVLDEAAGQPTVDPHGRSIPHDESAES